MIHAMQYTLHYTKTHQFLAHNVWYPSFLADLEFAIHRFGTQCLVSTVFVNSSDKMGGDQTLVSTDFVTNNLVSTNFSTIVTKTVERERERKSVETQVLSKITLSGKIKR